MSEIKFRAWDEQRKKMIDICSISKGINGEICAYDGDGTGGIPGVTYLSNLMQYTGKKDKTETKIYDGDILRCWKKYDTLDRNKGLEMLPGFGVAVIEFNGWTFRFKQISGSAWFFYSPDGCDFEIPHKEHQEFEWCEIIGNKHNNPELLDT